MTIIELLKAYDEDKLELQFLDQCTDSLNMNKGVTKVTFGTQQPIDLNGTAKLGIVVWLDRERVKQITAEARKPAA
jgi:hypothetical protein